ncbi:hypothetical protein RND71_021032 [Anisodus tanguticus]|uniref:Uncharacterized protein n=1 Tax=Anisodus tanguticus TaxID=243964 RepID=A0AAE1RXE0_9SOLA|nr:hypothetical protein RND71_021032 [Anisodus tanguticus]
MGDDGQSSSDATKAITSLIIAVVANVGTMVGPTDTTVQSLGIPNAQTLESTSADTLETLVVDETLSEEATETEKPWVVEEVPVDPNKCKEGEDGKKLMGRPQETPFWTLPIMRNMLTQATLSIH